MAAGDDEGERGEGDLAVGEERRLHVAGHVVHGDEGEAVHEGDALGRLHAHEERAHEPRPLGHRHGLEIREAHRGLVERGLDHRADVLDVVA